MWLPSGSRLQCQYFEDARVVEVGHHGLLIEVEGEYPDSLPTRHYFAPGSFTSVSYPHLGE